MENLCKALFKQAKELNFVISGVIVIDEGNLYWFDNRQDTQAESQNMKAFITVKDTNNIFSELNSKNSVSIKVGNKAVHFTQTNPQVLYTYH
ncbi:hypothetical protein [Candidatus Photodesmus katoptron]|nr:hypothetical protein [Candidatus Photodesmus katoptron]